MDRYTKHICDCLEEEIKNAEDGYYCKIGVVTAQAALDIIKEQAEQIEKLTPKNGMNLKELWEKARSGETLSENEWKLITADWDLRNGYNQR